MPRHRRRRVGPFVSRSTYMALWRRYAELESSYRVLETDHQGVLEDHEGLLYDLEAPTVEVETPQAPVSGPRTPHVPSWAETDEIPVITTAQPGLDPDKADALVRRANLLDEPSGSWESPGGITG